MIAKELITDEIPPLKVTDSGLKALKWMDDFKVANLPVVDNMKYLGVVSEADILDHENPDQPLKDLKLDLARPFVPETVHIYEVMKLISDLNLSVVPVLDMDENYVGLTHIHHLMKVVVNTASISIPGGVIILEMAKNDYSMSEIAQIVEGNDAKILSSYITSGVDTTEIEVTIKVNRTDLRAILQTFDRYEYNVKASYHQELYGDDMKDRYESFMNYLNI